MKIMKENFQSNWRLWSKILAILRLVKKWPLYFVVEKLMFYI